MMVTIPGHLPKHMHAMVHCSNTKELQWDRPQHWPASQQQQQCTAFSMQAQLTRCWTGAMDAEPPDPYSAPGASHAPPQEPSQPSQEASHASFPQPDPFDLGHASQPLQPHAPLPAEDPLAAGAAPDPDAALADVLGAEDIGFGLEGQGSSAQNGFAVGHPQDPFLEQDPLGQDPVLGEPLAEGQQQGSEATYSGYTWAQVSHLHHHRLQPSEAFVWHAAGPVCFPEGHCHCRLAGAMPIMCASAAAKTAVAPAWSGSISCSCSYTEFCRSHTRLHQAHKRAWDTDLQNPQSMVSFPAPIPRPSVRPQTPPIHLQPDASMAAQVMEWANQYYEQGYTQEQVEAWMAGLTPDAPQVGTPCTRLHCSAGRPTRLKSWLHKSLLQLQSQHSKRPPSLCVVHAVATQRIT